MSILDALAIVAAGLAAGTINTIVGSGSLITFPTLLALAYSPVVANVSNTLGLVPGSVSGVVGYRRRLEGQRARAATLGTASLGGGLTGSVLLLVLPGTVFRRVVPVLILGACALVALGPRLSRRRAERPAGARAHGGLALWLTIFATGIYGGYFGAAQGVVLIGLLGIFLDDDLQRLNALKNVLASIANGVAAVVFVLFAHVAWGAAGLLAAGSVVGGQLGARLAQRIPAPALRAAIVVVGTIVGLRLLIWQ